MVRRNSGYIGRRIDTRRTASGAYGINEMFDVYNSRVSGAWPFAKHVTIGLSTVNLNETDNRNLTVSLTTTGFADATSLFWTLEAVSGNVNSTDFNIGFTGSLSLSGNEAQATGSFGIVIRRDATADGVDQFRVQVREGSTAGPILQTSNTITVADTHTINTDLEIFSEFTGPNSSLTGGWTATRAGGTIDPVMSIQSNRIGLQAPYWCDGDARTNNNIDFSGAVSMTVVWESSGVTPTHYFAGINWPTTTGEAGFSLGSPSFANIAKNTIVIPITNGGVGRLRLRVTNSNAGSVFLYSVNLNY